jgi:putative DNA-invertase from lambdoid prophage Rac
MGEHAGKTAIYHRVSTLDQDPSAARQELRAAATARSLVTVLEIEETGSGARNDRPGLQRVMESATRHRIDTLLCWKLDRFGRSALDLLSNLRQLEDHGVRFIACSQGIDIRPNGDPMSRLILTVLAGVAEFERSLIVERTKLGLQKALRNGQKLGRRVSRDAPNPATVAALRASGASWEQIGRQLGCHPSAARRAAARSVGKGVPIRGECSDGETSRR